MRIENRPCKGKFIAEHINFGENVHQVLAKPPQLSLEKKVEVPSDTLIFTMGLAMMFFGALLSLVNFRRIIRDFLGLFLGLTSKIRRMKSGERFGNRHNCAARIPTAPW